jgi:hypothetical protein
MAWIVGGGLGRLLGAAVFGHRHPIVIQLLLLDLKAAGDIPCRDNYGGARWRWLGGCGEWEVWDYDNGWQFGFGEKYKRSFEN